MQHVNKTVSHGNKFNIGHEEKQHLAVMQTLDIVPQRAHFSGKEPATEDPEQSHYRKEQVLPSSSQYWGKGLNQVKHANNQKT